MSRHRIWQQDHEYKISLAADKAKEESNKAVLTVSESLDKWKMYPLKGFIKIVHGHVFEHLWA